MPFPPLVSVIIPVHNSQDFIDRCLQSVLNQSEKNIEIIIVDDQSSDGTPEIIEGYKSRYEHLRLFKTQTRLLAGGARNIGLGNSRGKFVCFLDSDDWIDSNFLHCMIESIESAEADVAICGVKKEYANAKDSEFHYRYNVSNTISGTYALCLLSRVIDQDVAISAIPTNKIFRADFIRKNRLRFLENSINEDDVFMFMAFVYADRVSITDKVNYHLFQRPNSISRQFSKRNISDLFDAFRTMRGELERLDLFSKYKREYCSFLEKCLQFVFETMRLAEQDERALTNYLNYAYEISEGAIEPREFIEYCGHRRIERFFAK